MTHFLHFTRFLAGASNEDHHYGEYNLHNIYHTNSSEGYEDVHSHDGGDGHHSEFGVHITYQDLYNAIVFLVSIYVCGQIASRILRMPNLVGEIGAGILLGPPLANLVPFAEAWVMLGEIGLVLLVLEAGIDIDVSTLKLIGTRGLCIAIVGSILPIALGFALTLAINGTDDISAAIAAGACFGPTSLGIALNILRSGGILNTPVGQLIVSAAVIDDMIALIILSQLESLAGTITVTGVVVPIVSALLFLIIGGYVALYIIPGLMERFILSAVPNRDNHGKVEMAVMFGFLLAMMPATYFAKASYLMGAFVSGLAFCTSHPLHAEFVRQFKRVLQWLMRVFFAASIGFQVPVLDFSSVQVLWQGCFLTLALTGKLAVGFLVPNFSQSPNFTKLHLRDCLLTGFSMAAEGEFAFVIAVFSVDAGLISKQLYASVVLAILLSTIVPPFLLRATISNYNKQSQQAVQRLAADEMEHQHEEVAVAQKRAKELLDRSESLVGEIKNETAVFLCIHTQSDSRWGLLHEIMACLGRQLQLDIIDHRSWHPRGINATLVNEIYVKDMIEVPDRGDAQAVLDQRVNDIRTVLQNVIDGNHHHRRHQRHDGGGEVTTHRGKVKVQRWYPGAVQEVIEAEKKKQMLEESIAKEAAVVLDRKQRMHLSLKRTDSVNKLMTEEMDNVSVTDDDIRGHSGNGGKGNAGSHRRLHSSESVASSGTYLSNRGGGSFRRGELSVPGQGYFTRPRSGSSLDPDDDMVDHHGVPVDEHLAVGDTSRKNGSARRLRGYVRHMSSSVTTDDMLDHHGVPVEELRAAVGVTTGAGSSRQLRGYVRHSAARPDACGSNGSEEEGGTVVGSETSSDKDAIV